jgi:hypothetical protein
MMVSPSSLAVALTTTTPPSTAGSPKRSFSVLS